MDPDNYKDSRQVERVFAIVRVLGGHTCQGLTTGEIARAINNNHSVIIRTIAQLAKLNVVQEARVPGRWRLGPFMVQLALAHQLDIQSNQRELDEITQRYSRKA
jgi:DNA-binding IclR family transcriptional regulator